MPEQGALTERVIGLAIAVHAITGPGLLESAYQTFLCMELEDAGIPYVSQAVVPVIYKNRKVAMGFRADILAADSLIVEIKAVPTFAPEHRAQLLTYLRMSQIKVGLLMNFNARKLKHGLLRCVM
jgi:GxxExxY protein